MRATPARLRMRVVLVVSLLMLVLVAVLKPVSAATSGTGSVTFTFEEGNNGEEGGIAYGTPNGNPPFVRDGFMADVVQTGSYTGAMHFHELDSTLNDKVPDRPSGDRGVLWRDGFANQDPVFFKPVDPNATFSLKSLIIGTTSADDAAANVQLTGFLHGSPVATIILAPPVDGYASYSAPDLGALQSQALDRLEFTAVGNSETGYYMLDNVVLGPAIDYRLPFIGGPYRITNGPTCGMAPNTHEGWDQEAIDFGLPRNTAVVAAEEGEVVWPGLVKRAPGNLGLYLQIRHADGSSSYYAHLKKLVVATGDKVVKGQLIAYSGMSGNARGPHLHFQVNNADGTPRPIRTLPGITWTSQDPNYPCQLSGTDDGIAFGP